MTTPNNLGTELAADIDWSGFGPVCQTIYCKCDAVFRSHHRLHMVGATFVGVSMEPCPQCGSHISAVRASSDPESYSVRR